MGEVKKDINNVAMEVILHAGNGREKIDEAFAEMAKPDLERAETLLKEAETEIVQAHIAQTGMIQDQVSGEDVEYSLLFIHAQDTLMTINTELRMAQKFMPVVKMLIERTDEEKK
jgi:PTS system cellobiose-specific IIA component